MDELHSTINSVASGIAILGVLWLAAVKVTRLEVKVETMWAFLLKRAVVEGVFTGQMETNSPVRLIGNSGDILVHMQDELQEFYKTKLRGLHEAQMALEIEKKFGDRLAVEICIPNQISFGICLIIAVAVAKGEDTLTEILDSALTMNKNAPIIRRGEK